MAAEPKTESFLMRMGVTEARMLAELSERSGLTRSDVVRQLIRREHARQEREDRVVSKAPKVKRKPRK